MSRNASALVEVVTIEARNQEEDETGARNWYCSKFGSY